MTLAVWLLTLGATLRTTRLITDDAIAGPPRAWIMRHYGPDHWTSYLLHCPWCISPYIGAALYTAAWYIGHTPAWLITTSVLTASWIIGITASWLDNPGTD